MAETQDIEALVELVAERVSQRLGITAGSTLAALCQAGSSDRADLPGADAGVTRSGECSPRASRVAPAGHAVTSADMARYIDHTLLKPEATHEDIVTLCEEARQHGFATVCVNSANIGLAARLLHGTSTVAIAVVGFPLGAALPCAKAFEAREAVRCGAREIDTVLNIGALKSRDYKLVFDDIKAVVDAVHGVPVKVILETSQLDTEQKIIGCALAKAAGAAFVKTSTGFGGGGATVEDVALMRRIVGDDMGVKASGGVRSLEDAQKMIAAGADRIGASASVAIVTALETKAGS